MSGDGAGGSGHQPQGTGLALIPGIGIGQRGQDKTRTLERRLDHRSREKMPKAQTLSLGEKSELSWGKMSCPGALPLCSWHTCAQGREAPESEAPRGAD